MRGTTDKETTAKTRRKQKITTEIFKTRQCEDRDYKNVDDRSWRKTIADIWHM